jgi:uncharacterized repeat protein (TIGR03803 family)
MRAWAGRHPRWACTFAGMAVFVLIALTVGKAPLAGSGGSTNAVAASQSAPQWSFAPGVDGLFYGAQPVGKGKVLRAALGGGASTLRALRKKDGTQPVGELAAAADGWLYGAASGGGPNLQGTIYRVNPLLSKIIV